jgi:hypothetical protein
MIRALVVFLVVIVSAGGRVLADSPRQAFERGWEGRVVTVRAPLYSLVYNERGKFGTSRTGLREGLSVALPSGDAYLQFDGRQGRDGVVETDPRKVIAAVNVAYQPDALDVRSYRKLEALSVARYDPGARLYVTDARVERDEVRIRLATSRDGIPVTGLRVKWSMPLSPSFEERGIAERVVRQFLHVNPF